MIILNLWYWMGENVGVLSVIATAAMAILTFCTLMQNRKQMREINRARLIFSIISYQSSFYLKIENCGNETAYNINLFINEDYIDNLLFDNTKNKLKNLKKSFNIAPNSSKYYYLFPIMLKEGSYIKDNNQILYANQTNKWLEKNKDRLMKITGIYCNKYKVKEQLSVISYVNDSDVVNDNLTTALESIEKSMVVYNDTYMPIQKSLDIIAKELKKRE